jgi:two-component sensor histidine kinase
MTQVPSTVASLEQELIAAGDGLAGNPDVLRSVLAGCGDCIKILDLQGRLQFMSEGGKRVMEVDDFGSLKGCPWPDFWEGAGNVEAKKAVATAIAGGVGRFSGHANTAKGTPRYWDVQVSPILGDDGKPSQLLSISRDITEQFRSVQALREASERQALLTGELEHRIKNTLAVVSAMARQTLRGDHLAVEREKFDDRLQLLSQAHDMLTKSNWAGAPIKDVVEGALAPYRTGQGRFHISGPDLQLNPKQALALAMAMHELMTNAIKYGSLSCDANVDIVWSNDVIDNNFRLTWTESGGPKVVEPQHDAKGFGSRLLDRILINDFDGSAKTHYRSSGLVFELVAPLIRKHDQAQD